MEVSLHNQLDILLTLIDRGRSLKFFHLRVKQEFQFAPLGVKHGLKIHGCIVIVAFPGQWVVRMQRHPEIYKVGLRLGNEVSIALGGRLQLISFAVVTRFVAFALARVRLGCCQACLELG